MVTALECAQCKLKYEARSGTVSKTFTKGSFEGLLVTVTLKNALKHGLGIQSAVRRKDQKS